MHYLSRSTPRPLTSRRVVLNLDCLEVRDVPSATVDLTSAGSTGSINGALFAQVAPQPTGTGVINSFVRVQALGNKTVEAGYNTSARPLAYDENNSPQFTRSLRVSDTPVYVDPSTGIRYREFLLDINQKASAPLLSLDALKVYVSDNGALSGKLDAAGNLAGATLKYDMDAGGDAWVGLNARLSTGSGSGDMVFRVPEAQLGGGTYLYLYSMFGGAGGAYAANGGFEEWAVQGAPGGAVVDSSVVTGRLLIQTFGDGVSDVPVPTGTFVYLLDASNTVIDVAQTDSDGNFQFKNVALSNAAASFTVKVGSLDPTAGDYIGLFTFSLPPTTTATTYDLGPITVNP